MNNNMPTSYHESIAAEFEAVKNRVRHFIDNRHWGEDGRFKEIVLINYLKKVLPSNASVGTGFVKGKSEISSQIDIIVYNNQIPVLFSEGDFVIVIPESVCGIIEIKSKIKSNTFKETVMKSCANGRIINNKNVFNGIFGFDTDLTFSSRPPRDSVIQRELRKNLEGHVNHICFGSDIFCKYWDEESPYYSFYNIKNLSMGYFISNLIEFVISNSPYHDSMKSLRGHLYPIPKGKEDYKLDEWEVR